MRAYCVGVDFLWRMSLLKFREPGWKASDTAMVCDIFLELGLRGQWWLMEIEGWADEDERIRGSVAAEGRFPKSFFCSRTSAV